MQWAQVAGIASVPGIRSATPLRIAIGRSTRRGRERMVTCIEAVIDKCKLTRSGDGLKKNCGVTVAVQSSKFQDTFLAKPDDDFWPMARYKAKFGSPLLPKNKQLNHVATICDEIKGVIVPGDDGCGPFKIKNRSGIRIEKDTGEDIGSGSDDHELAETKFADLRQEQTKMY